MTANRRTPRRPRRVPVLVALVLLLATTPVLGFPTGAGAHSDLAGSDPADGASVGSAVQSVALDFTRTVDPVDEQFAIAGPDGVVSIASVEGSAGNTRLTVTPAQPLAGGAFVVTWAIRAADSHTTTGTVEFDVAAEPSAGSDGEAEPEAGASIGEAPAGVASAGTAPVDPESTGVASTDTASADLVAAPTGTPLAERLATVALAVVYAALLLAVGGVAFLAFVHRGDLGESRLVVHVVRRGAAVLVVASAVAFLVQLAVFDGGSPAGILTASIWADVIGSGHGAATLLRLVGAALVLTIGASRSDVGRMPGTALPDEHPGADPVAAEPDGSGGTTTVVRRSRRTVERAVPSPAVWAGVTMLLVSGVVLGHTAHTDPRVLMAASDVVHLAAGAVWFAGVALLALLFRRRARLGSRDANSALVARFSVAATWALVGVGVSGAVMAISILSGDGASWTSPFALVLYAKVVAVGAAAALGGYNGRVLLPRLEAGGDEADGRRLRTSVTVEAALFVVVIGLTAALVTSSPT